MEELLNVIKPIINNTMNNTENNIANNNGGSKMRTVTFNPNGGYSTTG